jgi:hypothetical protein
VVGRSQPPDKQLLRSVVREGLPVQSTRQNKVS